jgi:hypothetical protein
VCLKTFTISKYVLLTRVSCRFLIFLVAVFSITAEIQNRAIKGIVPSFLQNISKQLNVDSSNSGLNKVQHRSLERLTRPSRKLNSLKVIMRHCNPFFSSTTTPHPTAPISNSAPAPVTVTPPSYATSISESTTYAASVHLTHSVNTPRTSPLVVIPFRSLVPRSNSLFSI